jgi:hypothetical protein
MECIFCHKIFSSKSSLSTHQKTTKYCLKLQNKEDIINFNCEYCNKSFTSKQQLVIHFNVCVEKKIKEVLNEELEKKQIEYENKLFLELQKKDMELKEKIKEKDTELKEKDMELKEKIKEKDILKEQLAELRGQLSLLKENHEFIKEIAKQPKITNTTNNLNITSSIDFNNIEMIKDVIESDFNINYAIDGQKGIAKFISEKLLKDENGNLKYICTDPSRQIFKYKDNIGEIKKDVEAKKLTNYILVGGIKKKVIDVANDWYKDINGEVDIDKFNVMIEKQQNILKIEEDNNSFKKELVALTTI